MAKSKFHFTHWVPSKKRLDDFPISYDITAMPEEEVAEYLKNNKVDLTIDYTAGSDLKNKIKEEVIKIFPFYKYADKNLPTYMGNSGDNDIEYKIEIKVYTVEVSKTSEGKSKKSTKLSTRWIVTLSRFKTNYSFSLVRSMEQLKSILDNKDILSFDLETTGLNPEIDKIVGVAFSVKEKEGYYIPIAHDEKFSQFNLGFPALDYFYDVMLKARIVFIFNARFDMRMMEYSDRHYDMSKIKVIDVQITCWYADPDYRSHDLKSLEKRFAGYYRIDLSDTMKAYGSSGYDTSKISPENILFYGAQDGISTLEVGLITYKYYKEFKLSGDIDIKLLYPLMKMENESIRIDMKYLEEQINYIKPRLDKIEELMKEQIGEINLNSSKQKSALFESFGLDTKVKTEGGAMSTSKEAVTGLINRIENRGDKPPLWLTYMNERANLQQLYSTFFNSLYEQAKLNDGRIRINYRNTQAATGRLSSGKELL